MRRCTRSMPGHAYPPVVCAVCPVSGLFWFPLFSAWQQCWYRLDRAQREKRGCYCLERSSRIRANAHVGPRTISSCSR
eukprot:5899740-Pleurochrysis_carterae.AAC.2